MPLRVLQSRGFSRAARKLGLSESALRIAAAEIAAGLSDAKLGGVLLKKRIARGGRGKSGGFRTIAAYREDDRLVFVHVFAKNERGNITERERLALLAIGEEYMRLSRDSLDRLVGARTLIEVANADDEEADESHSR